MFGGLTTVVGFGTYFLILFLARSCFGIREEEAAYNAVRAAAQVIQWIAAVLFAFVTNKRIVFRHEGEEVKTLAAFFLSRLFSLGVDSLVTFGTVALLVRAGKQTVTLLHITASADLVGKLFSAVFVIVLNYILGKFLVFRKKKELSED